MNKVRFLMQILKNIFPKYNQHVFHTQIQMIYKTLRSILSDIKMIQAFTFLTTSVILSLLKQNESIKEITANLKQQ